MSEIKRIKLKSLKIVEKRGNIFELESNVLLLNDLNLLIGDNAQGKTRLFNTLVFLFSFASGKPKKLGTKFNAILNFEICNTQDKENILYEINVEPNNGKNTFCENIERNGKTIFSSKNKILLNEAKNVEIKEYFMPENMPGLSSISGPDFITINMIQNFFKNIVHISPDKARGMRIGSSSTVPDDTGENIASVISNWSKSNPEIFNEVINEFKACFPFVNKLYFTDIPIKIFKSGMGQVLTIHEDMIEKEISQHEWSSGFYRILHLIMSAKTPFSVNNQIEPPSLILIDEIENGLDYKRLKFIINYFKDHSDTSQIIMTSHSPLTCDFINPDNWIVVKRKGYRVNFMSPKTKEDNINEELELFKQNHWDFYIKHISNSKKYIVE